MRAEAMKTGKLVGYINGLHGWHSAIREHSPAEQRFVTYVSLIGGAKMLLYFGGPYTMNMELRETFPSLSHELATLTPIVANPEVRQRVACDRAKTRSHLQQSPLIVRELERSGRSRRP